MNQYDELVKKHGIAFLKDQLAARQGECEAKARIIEQLEEKLAEQDEPVAWGHPNTSIFAADERRLLMVRLDIPGDAQYPEKWLPLYLRPQRAGWTLVPNEPTEEMKIAGMEESPLCIKRMFNDKYTGQVSGFDTDSVGSIYKAMIEAAKKESLTKGEVK